MNSTHIHLLLNHFPIIGTMLMVVVLAFGIFSNSRRTTKIALILLVVLSLISIPVYLTGEPAEHTVKNLPDVTRSIIHEHEESAEFAIWFMALVGVMAAITLVNLIVKEEINKVLVYGTLFLGIFTCTVMARTGYLGGLIRHSEIRDAKTIIDETVSEPNSEHE